MDGLVIISILVLGGLLIRKIGEPSDVRGMQDNPVSIENIRRGVQNGWYSCTLITANGLPAVRLSGYTRDGKLFTDVYPVTQEDWQTLKNEGYKVEA